ncbi:MAG: methyl-accepting chemotaxis protein, partial [Pseudomonadota bacterium]
SESVSDVTRAVSEQALGIKEISGALAQVDSNTQKQAAAFEEVTASSHLLASKATDLQTSTSRFQTGNKGARRAKNRSKHPKERLQARVSARPNDNLPILQPARAAGAEDLGAWDEF